MSGLGRRVPTDWAHTDRYPLTAATAPTKPVPVVIGVAWYSDFDRPVRDRDGTYWIGRRQDLGTVRGGHCVCLLPAGVTDPASWWVFYDQGSEGACVGFGSSRCMSLLNRKRYAARWLWDEAKKIDEWPDTNPGDDNGTSVRAAMDVLRGQGHRAVRNGHQALAKPSEGIAANRWATSVDDALKALGAPERDYVTVLNSWGRDFPRRVRMPAGTLERLRLEDGELAIPTDR